VTYKLIIFDFDGTLADTFPFVLSIIDQVADKYNFRKINQAEIDRLRDYDARKVLKYLGIPFWKVPTIANYGLELLAKEIDRLVLFEGIGPLLQALSNQGTKLAIVSANRHENILKVLGPENAALINYYECGVPIFGKQSKLKRILHKTGLRPDEAICIGDEIRDIHAAQKVKIPFGAVSWGYTKVEALRACSPHEVFTSVAEMAEKIM
jgi:phosphoglycolate phosphatase